MEMERINKFIGTEKISIVDAMEKIDQNAHGVLYVVDSNDCLIGALSDGDIRRWIMKGGELTAPVSRAMNTMPKSLSVSEKSNAAKIMKEKSITTVPIVDEKMHIINICVLSEMEDYNEPKADMSGVPVVVMAGGKGTRLYPYTKILPKPLIPIGDTPIVERIIECYTEYGIRKFYMTVNYKKGMIRSYFADINPDYSIAYVEENMPLGTCGSIKLIQDKFKTPIFVTNCDALILADYADIYNYHLQSGNSITIVSALKNITVPYGVLRSGENGELISMEEKPKLSYFINTGMYVINPYTIDMIPDYTVFHMTHLVEAVMKQGGKVGTYPISEDSFLDMGEFSEMQRMEEKLHIVPK